MGTLSLDQNTFIAWGRQLSVAGAKGFYNGWSDYLPGYLYVLWFLSKIELVFPIALTVLYKIPAILGDLAAGVLVYHIAKKTAKKYALLAACLVLFNPAVLANSTFWGQVDILTALFALASIHFLPKNKWLSALLLAGGTLVKPQAALAAPIILFQMLKSKSKWKDIALYIGFAGILFSAAFLPFMDGGSLVMFISSRLGQTLGQYPYGSVNAFNFWGLWGFWQSDMVGAVTPKTVGYILFSLTSVIGFLKTRNKEHQHVPYFFLAILLLSNFLFFTRMHERHLLPAIVALAPVVAMQPAILLPFLLLSFSYVINMRYAYVWILENFREILTPAGVVFVILINIISLGLVIYPTVIEQFISKLKRTKLSSLYRDIYHIWTTEKELQVIKDTLSRKRVAPLLIAILTFAFVTRIISLHQPANEYFDEVYHAFTAREMMKGNNAAWEWWNTPPEGFAYEWTHPPFAKLAMVGGMKIFGENSFGWRFPAAVFGTGSVFVLYLLSKKLFKSEEVALLAAALFSLDGLALVLSRIGMNDIYLLFFMLLSFYLFLKSKYFYSAGALGLAAASKWSTLWFFPILVFTTVLMRKKPSRKMIWFLLLPPILYVVNYLPQFLSGHSWDIFWGMQKQMWWYHTGLVATHPFSSTWWSWPLLLRPIWLYTSGVADGMTSNIYAMGNPIIFWGGFISIFVSIYYVFRDRSRALLLVVFAYLAVFMPWSMSPRIMFLYHYFPAVPFLCMSLAYVLVRNKRFVIPFLILATIVFVYFYPRLTGLWIPTWLNDSYFWLPSWR